MQSNPSPTTISTFPRNTSYQQYMLGFYTGSEGVPKYKVFYSLASSNP